MADRNRQILYKATLEGNLFPLPIDLNIGRSLTFKQDNDPMYIARNTLKLLKAKHINV